MVGQGIWYKNSHGLHSDWCLEGWHWYDSMSTVQYTWSKFHQCKHSSCYPWWHCWWWGGWYWGKIRVLCTDLFKVNWILYLPPEFVLMGTVELWPGNYLYTIFFYCISIFVPIFLYHLSTKCPMYSTWFQFVLLNWNMVWILPVCMIQYFLVCVPTFC